MSGELQTVPARHGVATFVPRGRTIKIINTYGKQVVSTWAFALNEPPNDKDNEIEDEAEKVSEEVEQKVKEEAKEGDNVKAQKQNEESEKEVEKPKEDATTKESEDTSKEGQEEFEDPPEQAPEEQEQSPSQPQKKTWSSYLPSIPYRSKAAASNQSTSKQAEPSEAEKAQNAENSRKWSSYLPTGKGFSSYVPNVQIPDSKGVMSAFKASHYRDPNKSYAEQLYDFSKTPVGAGGIAAATGSGTASSLYAAYNAYAQLNPSKSSLPPMEYLSLPHTRASSKSLVPEVNDTLLTNLRNPIVTLIEDTTPGAHDTLTAACDASAYAALGVEKPEEHGSCAENLVLALKQINEKAGLKGAKAVGADITVNIAPTPLHLFMNAPLKLDNDVKGDESGAKGAKIHVEEPKGKKRSYVKFRAERDIVIVMSSCPMDVGNQNGGRCMAANFVVEEASEPPSLSNSAISSKKEEKEEVPKTTMPKPRGGPAKINAVKKSAETAQQRRDSGAGSANANTQDKTEDKKTTTEETSKPKKKPKKLERRSGSTPSATS